MREIRILIGLTALVIGLSSWAPPRLVAAEFAWRTLTIRVYDSAPLSAMEWSALDVARGILQMARLSVVWRPCAGAHSEPTMDECAIPRHEDELIIRLVRGPASPSDSRAYALGDAMVDATSPSPALITIYRDRVRQFAAAARRSEAVLLGRVMAHELIHATRPEQAHSLHGLMRPVWTLDEVRRNRDGDWATALPALPQVTQ